ncbi:hypothetical protein DV515_00012611 [Chloebia gouldiae]|uniref:Hydin adenylate kinase-like domain-containing protein n=1 Tax=Chloebia gouldiae TaxID=44316 RepID=A0A3L8S465_CHLGU|nr:hypothetical protein DV515_00012611 [Chloebia gouldiae]
MGPPGPSPGAPSLHCRAVLVSTREEPQLQAQQWEFFRAFHRGFFSLQWFTLQFTVSTAPAPQQLNIISSRGEELNCLSCVLPEDLLVDILSERLKVCGVGEKETFLLQRDSTGVQLGEEEEEVCTCCWRILDCVQRACKDCYKGVVFDGLETLFASSLESSSLCVLRAVKNCHHIYMVNLHQDYASWKAKEEAKRKEKKAEKEKEGEISPSNLLSQALNHISVYLDLQQSFVTSTRINLFTFCLSVTSTHLRAAGDLRFKDSP